MSQENVEIVKDAYARSSRGDFDGLLALFDPGVEWVDDPLVAGAVARRGHAEVKRYFESLAQGMGGVTGRARAVCRLRR